MCVYTYRESARATERKRQRERERVSARARERERERERKNLLPPSLNQVSVTFRLGVFYS